MPDKFAEYLAQKTIIIEQALAAHLTFSPAAPQRLAEAMRYAVLNGGKRIRPVLMLAVAELLRVPEAHILPVACALEIIHSYSLAHDDLPCMDDDDRRRGRPACHKQFDEATALLAGDTLQVYAYELIVRDCARSGVEPRLILQLIQELSRASGIYGMAGGQMLDLSGETRDLDGLQKMHRLKTGALLAYAVTAPLVLTDAPAEARQALSEYAQAVGLAFQIKDDILDVEGLADVLGKTPGKDRMQQKATYVTLLGLAEAKKLLKRETARACQAAKVLGGANRLRGIIYYLLKRKN